MANQCHKFAHIHQTTWFQTVLYGCYNDFRHQCKMEYEANVMLLEKDLFQSGNFRYIRI